MAAAADTSSSQSRHGVADLLILGGGLAGVSAASAAVKQGYRVTLISAHDRHPPDFRGEKLGPEQMALFEKFGLGDAAHQQMTAFHGAWTHRFGRLADKNTNLEYASDYSELVNAIRAAMPAAIEAITGKVVSLTNSESVQTATLADGRTFAGKLMVIATGLGDGIRRMAGIERVMVSQGHSLSIGFDLVEPPSAFEFPSLIWCEEAADPALSYLTVFPIGNKTRANLFVFRGLTDEWTRAFKKDPQAGLHAAMPRLAEEFGPMTITGDVIVRPIDLSTVRNHRQAGIVLLGDAYSVICPITGYGMAKALNDADRLVFAHLPRWLQTPGMSAEKLSSFYADPVKVALDETAMRDSLVGRKLKIDESLYWQLRRLRSTTLHRVRDQLRIVQTPELAQARRIG